MKQENRVQVEMEQFQQDNSGNTYALRNRLVEAAHLNRQGVAALSPSTTGAPDFGTALAAFRRSLRVLQHIPIGMDEDPEEPMFHRLQIVTGEKLGGSSDHEELFFVYNQPKMFTPPSGSHLGSISASEVASFSAVVMFNIALLYHLTNNLQSAVRLYEFSTNLVSELLETALERNEEIEFLYLACVNNLAQIQTLWMDERSLEETLVLLRTSLVAAAHFTDETEAKHHAAIGEIQLNLLMSGFPRTAASAA